MKKIRKTKRTKKIHAGRVIAVLAIAAFAFGSLLGFKAAHAHPKQRQPHSPGVVITSDFWSN